MHSVIVAMLSPPDSPEAALLVRRADGQFALERVDARFGCRAGCRELVSEERGRGCCRGPRGGLTDLNLEILARFGSPWAPRFSFPARGAFFCCGR
jgi:hypothetical protein